MLQVSIQISKLKREITSFVDIRPLSVLHSMRDKALELKHNLSSHDGKTLPVGEATAV